MLTEAKRIESLRERLRRVLEELALIRAAFKTKLHPYCPIDDACVICHRTPNQPSFRLFHDGGGLIPQTPKEAWATLSAVREHTH